jgi:NitT/TauT family transport system substrate-binding protein
MLNTRASGALWIAVDAGSTEKEIEAFAKGDHIHPAPQQLEQDGGGHIAATLGDAIGPCAFSSLAATREWLAGDMARRFMRAYRKARAWVIATPAAEIARVEATFFPGVDREVLAATIGCYKPRHAGRSRGRRGSNGRYLPARGIEAPPYEDVIAQPP